MRRLIVLFSLLLPMGAASQTLLPPTTQPASVGWVKWVDTGLYCTKFSVGDGVIWVLGQGVHTHDDLMRELEMVYLHDDKVWIGASNTPPLAPETYPPTATCAGPLGISEYPNAIEIYHCGEYAPVAC